METNYMFLLIEDNEIDQLITKQLFKKVLDIIDINIVNNGKEGIQWLYNYRRNSNKSLIILLDIQMPEMNGIRFLTEFGMLPEELKRETRIFMLTSSLDPEEIKKIKSHDFVTGFLSKPFPAKEFEKMMPKN